MKGLVLSLGIIFSFLTSSAQVSVSEVGVGFNFNGSYNANAAVLNVSPDFNSFFRNSYSEQNRILNSLEVGFKFENLPRVVSSVQLLQGVENVWWSGSTYDYSSSYNNNKNANLELTSSVVGLKTGVAFSTSKERNVYYDIGLFGEGLMCYGSDLSMNSSESGYDVNGQYYTTNTQYPDVEMPTYFSGNFIQEVGMGFRLSKKEKNYPLNQSVIKFDILMLTNVSSVNGNTDVFRTVGFNLAFLYEVK